MTEVARDILEWNDKLPEKVSVVKTSDDESATDTFSVVADYGWAERILCSGSYQQDAEAIKLAIEEACSTRLKEAEDALRYYAEGETDASGNLAKRHLEKWS